MTQAAASADTDCLSVDQFRKLKFGFLKQPQARRTNPRHRKRERKPAPRSLRTTSNWKAENRPATARTTIRWRQNCRRSSATGGASAPRRDRGIPTDRVRASSRSRPARSRFAGTRLWSFANRSSPASPLRIRITHQTISSQLPADAGWGVRRGQERKISTGISRDACRAG